VRRVLVRAAACAILACVVIGLVYVWGIFWEFEYPYWFVLRKVAAAHTWDGRPVAVAIREVFPPERYSTRWTTSSYADDLIKSKYPRVIFARLDIWPDRRRGDYSSKTWFFLGFAYDRQTREIIPATDETAERFPGLLPPTARVVQRDGQHFIGRQRVLDVEGWPR
jgi:hypothetical protein